MCVYTGSSVCVCRWVVMRTRSHVALLVFLFSTQPPPSPSSVFFAFNSPPPFKKKYKSCTLWLVTAHFLGSFCGVTGPCWSQGNSTIAAKNRQVRYWSSSGGWPAALRPLLLATEQYGRCFSCCWQSLRLMKFAQPSASAWTGYIAVNFVWIFVSAGDAS